MSWFKAAELSFEVRSLDSQDCSKGKRVSGDMRGSGGRCPRKRFASSEVSFRPLGSVMS